MHWQVSVVIADGGKNIEATITFANGRYPASYDLTIASGSFDKLGCRDLRREARIRRSNGTAAST